MEVPAHADTETLKRSRDYEILISDHTEKPRSEQEGQEPKEMITSEATPGRIVVETGIDVHSQKRPSQNDGLQKEEHGEMKMEGVESRQREENGEKNGGSIEMEKSKVKRESEEKGENKIAEGEATIVKLGPKSFKSSVDMFNYFHELSRSWPIDYNVNKYEFLVLHDLIKKGHQNPENKIGGGIKAFQLRVNPVFYSRCYYIIHEDGSIDDFSYRKCVDNILSLPVEFMPKNKSKHKSGGGRHSNYLNGSGRGGRHGSGRGNRGRYEKGNRGGGQMI